MIKPNVQSLIEQAIDSPTKLHLLLIFHENPRMEATATGIAERSCRDIWSVSQALQEMTEDGILRVHHGSAKPRYSYMPLAEYHESIEQLVRGYDDPIERDALHQSIRDLAGFASIRRTSPWELQVAVL